MLNVRSLIPRRRNINSIAIPRTHISHPVGQCGRYGAWLNMTARQSVLAREKRYTHQVTITPEAGKRRVPLHELIVTRFGVRCAASLLGHEPFRSTRGQAPPTFRGFGNILFPAPASFCQRVRILGFFAMSRGILWNCVCLPLLD